MIRIVVAAPSVALRAGLRALLVTDPDIDVIGEAATLSAARQVVSQADVLVVAGIEIEPVYDTREPVDMRVSAGNLMPALLVLTGDEIESMHLPPTSGWRTWGLLPIDCTAEELLASVKALHQGLLVGDPALLQPFLPSTARRSDNVPVEPLTEREGQVLQRLAQGLANKQIAAVLGISEHTVKFHVSAIYSKLGATSRTEAVRIGVRQGLIVL